MPTVGQALAAARTCDWPYPSARSLDLSNAPLLVGSGQFGKPWERMQRANASGAFGAVVRAPVVGDPPPQPAATSERAAVAAATDARVARWRERMGRVEGQLEACASDGYVAVTGVARSGATIATRAPDRVPG